jgi:hypothetical protein
LQDCRKGREKGQDKDEDEPSRLSASGMLADPSGGARLREDGAELTTLVEEPRTFRRFAHLTVVAHFHPQLTFVRFLENDAKTRGEFGV